MKYYAAVVLLEYEDDQEIPRFPIGETPGIARATYAGDEIKDFSDSDVDILPELYKIAGRLVQRKCRAGLPLSNQPKE